MGLSALLILAAVILFILGAVIAWPAHVTTLLLTGLACFSASFIVTR